MTAPQNAGTGAQFDAAANKVWSKGYGAAGYSLFTNLTSLIPKMAGYPVHYPVNSATQSLAALPLIENELRQGSRAARQKTQASKTWQTISNRERQRVRQSSLRLVAILKVPLTSCPFFRADLVSND
jgi:hypothetical protein